MMRRRGDKEIGKMLFALCSMQLFQDAPHSEEAREAGAHDAMRGASIMPHLKEAWNGSPMGRSRRTHLLGNGSKAIHRASLIPCIAL